MRDLLPCRPDDGDIMHPKSRSVKQRSQPMEMAFAWHVLLHYNQTQITTPFVEMERVIHAVRADPC